MDISFGLFEQVIRAEAAHMGRMTAYAEAAKAGLNLSDDGRVVGCSDEPRLVLLRLIKGYAERGSVAALAACAPLINEVLQQYSVSPGQPQIRTRGAKS